MELEEDVEFLNISYVKNFSDKVVSVHGTLRTDQPDVQLRIVVQHLTGQARTIEEMSMSYEEFLEVREIVDKVMEKVRKAEEVVL